MDMGPCNKAIQKILGIKVQKTADGFLIKRYFRCEELGIDWDVVVIADVPHLDKSIRNAFAGLNKDPKTCSPEDNF